MKKVYIETFGCHYSPQNHIPIYQSGVLGDGKHTLRLVRSDSMPGPVTIDAFAVEAEVD